MTLQEILALEEDEPCPGCPVCRPRLPHALRRPLTPANANALGRRESTPAPAPQGARAYPAGR